MSESMSNPWIRDYFTDVAETYGAQLYNAPVSKKKRKVQLTDLLTYQGNSYVWAWISDKDHRVPVRISKDAADQYKSAHGRSILDSRFFLVFVSGYRPMFSPRPLGPNTPGNTLLSHISLEIGYVSSIGTGGHLFGNPRDLESDENIKEWVLGLRQDGGGGNVLKLRKQRDLVQNKKAPPTPPPPLSLSPTPQHQITKTTEDVVEPKIERSHDFKRAYAKRWRKVEVDPWKFAFKPVVEKQPIRTELDHSLVEPLLDTANRLEVRGSSICPTSPHRTPSPFSLQRQGTPTDWSLSNGGSSPVAPDEANTSVFGNGIQQHSEPEVLPTISHLSSNTEVHAIVHTVITSDACSLQPPTPGQRIKCSPIHHSSSPPPSSPALFCSSPRPSQQLPRSSPPPPSSSLPIPSPTLPTHIGIRKNIQRKVPHPMLPVSQLDSTKQGPVQILVPNSDASGTGSSQSYSRSHYISQSQQYQPHLLSHSPALTPSRAKEFKPPEVPMLREEDPVDTLICTSKVFAESLSVHGDIDEQEIAPAEEHTHLTAVSAIQHPSPSKQDTNGVSTQHSAQLSERPGSQSSMHSLFSDSLEDGWTVSSYAPTLSVGQTEDKVQKANLAHLPRHDPETWKEPSFIAKNTGKGKARGVEEPDTSSVKVGKKRRRLAQHESPVPKRAKVAASEMRRRGLGETTAGILGHLHLQGTGASAIGSNNRPFPTDTTETTTPPTLWLSKPRLANFVVDFERLDLGKRTPIPRLDLENDIKSMLLRTGRIRASEKR